MTAPTPAEIAAAVIAESSANLDNEPNLSDYNHIDAYAVRCMVENGVRAGMDAAYKHAAESSNPLPHRPYRLATADELTEAWESMTSEDVSYFIQSWNDYTAGQDFACPEADTGLHEEADGTCENCGANRGETPA